MQDYFAEVGVAYRNDRRPGMFEFWTVILCFESAGGKQAPRDAVSITREAMESPANLRWFGYREKPVLYAVLQLESVSTQDLPEKPRLYSRHCFFITRMRAMSEADLDRLRCREDVPASIFALWLEE